VASKLIYITGASTGIGAALARSYASPGSTLCLLANADLDKLTEVAEQCERLGAKVQKFLADVGDRGRMHAVTNEILENFGLPDIVIANAGIGPVDPDEYITSLAPDRAMSVNYFGTINTFAGFIEPMKKRRSGQLVAISSVSALRSTPNSGIYSASKAAVNMWTEGLRFKLRPFGLYVTTICPGFVKTYMTDKNSFIMPGIIDADRAAKLIKAAVSKRMSRYYFPFMARCIWKTFYYLPDPLYDLIMSFAKRHWPDRGN
jgi:hypothetical protein